MNIQAFYLCSTGFNYGCQHGFFEYVLARSESPKAAAGLVCESTDESRGEKFKFYCYHGVGRGIMMAQAYDLQAALDVCDTLPSVMSQDGCWQGVFMENVNAGMDGVGEYRRWRIHPI